MLYDPEGNIQFGAWYIGHLLAKFKKQIPLGAGSYNAGPKAMMKWLKLNGERPLDEFIELCPYTQTREYMKKVLDIYARYVYLYEKEDYLPASTVDTRAIDSITTASITDRTHGLGSRRSTTSFSASARRRSTICLALDRQARELRSSISAAAPGEPHAQLADALAGARRARRRLSPEMLQGGEERARRAALSPAHRGLCGSDEQYDLVFSHAAMHWVARSRVADSRSCSAARAGRAARGAAAVEPRLTATARGSSPRRPCWRLDESGTLLPIARYAELLVPAGARRAHGVREGLSARAADADAMLEWVRGTALLPYLERLAAALARDVHRRVSRAAAGAVADGRCSSGFDASYFRGRACVYTG